MGMVKEDDNDLIIEIAFIIHNFMVMSYVPTFVHI